jgi:hypothetical protein
MAKLGIAWAALRRLKAHRAGVPGAVDPSGGHAKPWLFWAWIGWRVAAAALALVSGIWLLAR